MGQLVAKWKGVAPGGGPWTAMLTRERYGLHFSVHGWDEATGVMARVPTDAECAHAQISYKHGLWATGLQLQEVTSALESLGWKVNPHVRQFVPAEHASRLFELASRPEG